MRTLAVTSLCVSLALASSRSWNLQRFSSLVAFGDSYTDESRLGYFIAHNGSAPPVGWVDPPSNDTASGGYTWARYVADYTGATLYNYAVSGAVCSNDITPRWFSSINAPFPDVIQYEVPAYIADSKYHEHDGVKFLHIPPQETVYSIWIGTNDLGYEAFISDAQVAGKTIPDYINCVYQALDQVYANGGRYFVIMNVAPLNVAPIYATPANGGVGPNHYWPTKSGNFTEISYRMLESVVTVNDVFSYQTPYEVLIARRYPEAQFAIFNTHDLIEDIYNHPTEYLRSPANVTGYYQHCDITGAVCTKSGDIDSFLWFDELHPTTRTDQIIAQNFVDVVRGTSKWATYWG